MYRYAPGVYQLINRTDDEDFILYVDNERTTVTFNGTVTVLVYNNMYTSSSSINKLVKRISGNLRNISGNATKWTD